MKEVEQRDLKQKSNRDNQTGEQNKQVQLISRLEYKVLLYVFKYYGLMNTIE